MPEPAASSSTPPRRSPLHERHAALGARFAVFGGWEMPLDYPTGVLQEHAAVRSAVGLFDVSHLGKVTVTGPGAVAFLDRCLTNDLGRLGDGAAQYTLCCDEVTGGIVDDLIAYRYAADRVLLVPNAANAAEVAGRLRAAAPAGLRVSDEHEDHAVLAVQGPASEELLTRVGLPVEHSYMSFEVAPAAGGPGGSGATAAVTVCRTGYTGERGHELVVPVAAAGALWDLVVEAGADLGLRPCGLGARDTLRTEMGYPLHGQDLSPSLSPLEADLGRTVRWEKPEFWGREALLRQRESGPRRLLRGLVAAGRAIPRPGMRVLLVADVPLGQVTSGTWSPTLGKGVGLALLAAQVAEGAEVSVDVRGRREVFVVTRPPFVPAKVR